MLRPSKLLEKHKLVQVSVYSLCPAGFACCGSWGTFFSNGKFKMLCEFDLYSAHLVSIKTIAPFGLVVRHSGHGESSQAVLGKLESFFSEAKGLMENCNST